MHSTQPITICQNFFNHPLATMVTLQTTPTWTQLCTWDGRGIPHWWLAAGQTATAHSWSVLQEILNHPGGTVSYFGHTICSRILDQPGADPGKFDPDPPLEKNHIWIRPSRGTVFGSDFLENPWSWSDSKNKQPDMDTTSKTSSELFYSI